MEELVRRRAGTEVEHCLVREAR